MESHATSCWMIPLTAKDSGEEPLMRTVFLERTPLIRWHALIWCLAFGVNVLIAPGAAAQGGGLKIEYTVKVADIPGQLFHVTTDIRNINQPALEVSLPVWSPGWYVIENYAKNILRFRVSEPGGRAAATCTGA